jgi:hypothetical protein
LNLPVSQSISGPGRYRDACEPNSDLFAFWFLDRDQRIRRDVNRSGIDKDADCRATVANANPEAAGIERFDQRQILMVTGNQFQTLMFWQFVNPHPDGVVFRVGTGSRNYADVVLGDEVRLGQPRRPVTTQNRQTVKVRGSDFADYLLIGKVGERSL